MCGTDLDGFLHAVQNITPKATDGKQRICINTCESVNEIICKTFNPPQYVCSLIFNTNTVGLKEWTDTQTHMHTHTHT